MKTAKNQGYGTRRVMSIMEWGEKTLAHAGPQHKFTGRTLSDYAHWRRKFEAKYRELLGRFPESVPLRARVVERRVFPKYIRENIILDSERHMSVPAWLCRPVKCVKGEKLPAVVCCHGHSHGKDSYVGLSGTGKAGMDAHKSLAVQLACRGYVAIAPDWRCFGERNEPPGTSPDMCTTGSLLAQLLGYNLLTLDVWDGMKCIDYLFTRQEVDQDRLGCVGLSFGGTMSLHLSAADPRITAACVSGYLASTKPSGGWGNCGCGSQNLPGLLRWGDRAEVAGLICPRPLLIQIGQYDSVFFAHDALPAYRRLQRIYRAAGAAGRLELDLFDGCHEINAGPILLWFDRWLKQKS